MILRHETAPVSQTGYDLLFKGTQAFSRMSQNGVCVDVPYYVKKQEELVKEQEDLVEEIMDSEEAGKFQLRFRRPPNLGSNPDIGKWLYDVLDYPVKNRTAKTDSPSVREQDLIATGAPIVQKVVKWRKYGRLISTFIGNILEEAVDGLVHPNFKLDQVVTFRSSCDLPNWQNQPLHDVWMGQIIRTGVITPGLDFLMFEFDFSSQEVRVGACQHMDPRMIRYLDGGGDMHRDSSCELFILAEELVSKGVRFIAKSDFVFAEFYGSYFKDCAKNMWNLIQALKPRLTDGTLLIDHMKKVGIGTLAKFTAHVEKVEQWLWKKMFPKYDAWRDRVWQDYCTMGYIDLVTGFRCKGEMGRNDVRNYKIQGPAFHCLLWVLIEAMQEMEARGMQSYFVGQVHDSGLGYVHVDEMDDLFQLLNELATERLPDEWDWLTVPLAIEVEVGRTWYSKQLYDDWRTA